MTFITREARTQRATYSQPITVEEYINGVRDGDAAKLPPRVGRNYVVCVKPFVGTHPRLSTATAWSTSVKRSKTAYSTALRSRLSNHLVLLTTIPKRPRTERGSIQVAAPSIKNTALLARANCSSRGRLTHAQLARNTAYSASQLAVRTF